MTSMQTYAQLGAIDVLNSVINLAVAPEVTYVLWVSDNLSLFALINTIYLFVCRSTLSSPRPTNTIISPSPPERPDSSSLSTPSSKKALGPIIGGTLGGVGLLGLIIIAIVLILRRRYRRKGPATYGIHKININSPGTGSSYSNPNSNPSHAGFMDYCPVPFPIDTVSGL